MKELHILCLDFGVEILNVAWIAYEKLSSPDLISLQLMWIFPFLEIGVRKQAPNYLKYIRVLEVCGLNQ